jgi:carboxymethylenebutenolidase
VPDVTIGVMPGYLAVPPTSPDPWPGVIVIHEAFGLNGDIRGHADRLAALGYLALAPDLYDGRSWVRCIRSAIRQLHAGSGPMFEALESFRSWCASAPVG